MAGLYDLEETIGEGHYAVVKLAKHVFTGEKVAVKVRNNLWCNIISKWWYWDRITEHKYLVFTIRFISVFGFEKSMNEHTILNKKKINKDYFVFYSFIFFNEWHWRIVNYHCFWFVLQKLLQKKSNKIFLKYLTFKI